MVVVQHMQSDGRICGVFRANNAALLAAQSTMTDATWGYVLVETALNDFILQEQYRIDDQGEMVAKTAVEIVAAPNPFAADGVSECEVTVDPFVPCTLLVDREPLVLTEEDHMLILTSADSHMFQIAVQPNGFVWGPAVLVEAT